MFERFTGPTTLVHLVWVNDLRRLKRVIAGGASIARRIGDFGRTPLDAASTRKNLYAAKMLLSAGAPIVGSSIYDAIENDAVEILRVFHDFDPLFYRMFPVDVNHGSNPRLNRWTSMFTALDFAVSIHSPKCVTFLTELGAPMNPSKCHGPSCAAILIEEKSFMFHGGVNIDGLTETTKGYYCAKCHSFIA